MEIAKILFLRERLHLNSVNVLFADNVSNTRKLMPKKQRICIDVQLPKRNSSCHNWGPSSKTIQSDKRQFLKYFKSLILETIILECGKTLKKVINKNLVNETVFYTVL